MDAVVHDSAILKYYASRKGKGRVTIVGPLLLAQKYAIAVQPHSPYTETINRALLRLMENGGYDEIYAR